MHSWKKALLVAAMGISFLSNFNRFTRCFAINADKATQLEATTSYSKGMGLTIEKVDIYNLAKSERQPLIGWPPGYSLLLFLLQPLTNDYIISTNILNILSIVLYLFIAYLILKILDINYWAIVLFYAFTAVSNQLILTLTTTDLISLDLFLLMFYLLLYIFRKNRTDLKFFILIGFIGFGSAFVKYNFLLLVFIFPLFLIGLGLFQNNKFYVRGGIICGVCMLLLVGGYLGYQKFFTGHYTYLSAYAEGKRWYFENLSKHSPFLFELLFVRDPFKILPISLPAWVSIIPSVFTIISLFTILGFFWHIFKRVLNNVKSINCDSLTIIFGTLIIVADVGMLYYLSLTSPPQEDNNKWTYVEEFRYYAPACFFFLLFFLIWFSRSVNWARNVIGFILLCSIAFGIMNKVYKVMNYSLTSVFDTSKFDLRTKQDSQIILLDEVKKIVHENPEKRVLYTDGSSNQRLMAIAGAHTVWEFDEFIKLHPIYSSEPAVVLVGTHFKTTGYVYEFLKKNEFREVYSNSEIKLFRLDIEP